MPKSGMTTLKYLVIALIFGLSGLCLNVSRADTLSVACSSAPVTASADGGTVTADVDCTINAPDVTPSYRIIDSSDNFLVPGLVLLNKGLNVITASRQSSVTSPDGTVTSISGTSQGFTGRLSTSGSLQTLRFQYDITTSSTTPAGRYQSTISSPFYKYRICTNPSCSQQSFTGIAPTTLTVDVAGAPISVSCASPSVTATPGGGPFSLTVECTVSGSNASKMSPSSQNMVSPSTINLSSGSSVLTATLQPTVTSPDSSVTGITGTAGGGFSGNITALPAKIQVKYAGSTTNTTPAGTYTSTPVTFAWSTL
jgi:hypothetical protein